MSSMATGATPVHDQQRVSAAVETPARVFFADNAKGVGVSIGVYQRGRTFTFNYGRLSPGDDATPTADTIYPIASITKTFTGTLLAQAALAGKLKLDDDVRQYLDGKYPNLEFEGHPIRLFDLVDHRSGLPFFLPERPEAQPDYPGDTPWVARIARILENYTRQDFYADLHEVTLTAVPGEAFKYSNSGATLAGYIVERVYGDSYENLVKKKITAPLGMANTTITLTKKQAAARAHGYDGEGRLMPDNPDAGQGAGALKSSVRDMLKYIAWQMGERDLAVKLSHQSYVTTGNYAAGLNWQMLSAPGKRVIWQTGNIDGFHAYCIVEPERQLGLVVFFNQADRDTNAAHGIMVNDILKGLDPDAMLLP